jgi:hypothetical protein
MKVLR